MHDKLDVQDIEDIRFASFRSAAPDRPDLPDEAEVPIYEDGNDLQRLARWAAHAKLRDLLVPVEDDEPFDPNVMEALVFTGHVRLDRRRRAGLPVNEIFAALQPRHPTRPSGKDPGCTEHIVRMKGETYVVVTGPPNEGTKKPFEPWASSSRRATRP